MSEEKMVTITKAEYDILQGRSRLLSQVWDDLDVLDTYKQEYPELCKAAGVFDEDDEEDEEDEEEEKS